MSFREIFILLMMLIVGCGACGCGDDDDTGCPVGAEGCPCTSGSECDGDLVCASDTCVDLGGDSDADSDADSDGDADTDGDTDGDADPDFEAGKYYEDDEYHHFEILAGASEMRVYVVSDTPSDYCSYTNRGALTDNPSSGFVVDGMWAKFRGEQTWCGWIAEYAILSPSETGEITLRSHEESFELAYEEQNRNFTKK